MISGDEQIVDSILAHGKRGRGFQFLTLMKGDPDHDATWQPTKDFVDRDGTVTNIWLEYIKKNHILPEYH